MRRHARLQVLAAELVKTKEFLERVIESSVDAIISAVPALSKDAVPMSVGFVVILAYGNLRGIREAGRVFAIPTYFFIANMAVLTYLIWWLRRARVLRQLRQSV